MTARIKEISYLIPPRDIFNDALDVFVTLDDDYCSENFRYFVEITTPTFLSTLMEKEKTTFLSPDYPCLIVSRLTDDVIRAAIESFINSDDGVFDELYWLKLYHVMPKLTIEEIDDILNRKKQEEIELQIEIDAEFESNQIQTIK